MVENYITYYLDQPLVCSAVFVTPIPIFLILYRRAYQDPSFKLLLIFLVLKFIIDLAMLHYAAIRGNTIILYNISVPLRYIPLSGMFYFKFQNKLFRKVLLYIIGLFLIFTIWDVIHINPDLLTFHDHRMVAYSTTIESFLMIFWILYYFYETIRSLAIPNLLTFPFFWVCSGLLLFYASFAFIAPILTYAISWTNPLDLGILIYLPYIFEIIASVLFSVGVIFFPSGYHAKQ
jgi:hypothetical protein